MKDKVLSFLLLGVTAIATGWQQLYNLGWAVWGAPTFFIQYVGLLGSLMLAIASAMVFIRMRLALTVGLFAAGLVWCFYGPALWATIAQLWASPNLFSIEPLVLLPLSILLGLTVFLVYRLRGRTVTTNTLVSSPF